MVKESKTTGARLAFASVGQIPSHRETRRGRVPQAPTAWCSRCGTPGSLYLFRSERRGAEDIEVIADTETGPDIAEADDGVSCHPR